MTIFPTFQVFYIDLSNLIKLMNIIAGNVLQVPF